MWRLQTWEHVISTNFSVVYEHFNNNVSFGLSNEPFKREKSFNLYCI